MNLVKLKMRREGEAHNGQVEDANTQRGRKRQMLTTGKRDKRKY